VGDEDSEALLPGDVPPVGLLAGDEGVGLVLGDGVCSGELVGLLGAGDSVSVGVPLGSSSWGSGSLGESGVKRSTIRSGRVRRVSMICSTMFGSAAGPAGASWTGWEGCTRIGVWEVSGADELCSGEGDCDGEAEEDCDGDEELGVIVTTGVVTGRSLLLFEVARPTPTPVAAMAPAVTPAAIFMRATRRALIAKPTA
jgi:hypothetical protein